MIDATDGRCVFAHRQRNFADHPDLDAMLAACDAALAAGDVAAEASASAAAAAAGESPPPASS